MTIKEFIEYAKVFEKYIDLLEQEQYEVAIECDDEGDAFIFLDGRLEPLNLMSTNSYYTIDTPKDIENYLKKQIIKRKEKYLQEIQELQAKQKILENLIKTIDNDN